MKKMLTVLILLVSFSINAQETITNESVVQMKDLGFHVDAIKAAGSGYKASQVYKDSSVVYAHNSKIRNGISVRVMPFCSPRGGGCSAGQETVSTISRKATLCWPKEWLRRETHFTSLALF